MSSEAISDQPQARRGKVYLVGAGPGAAGLFTLRGVEVLRAADVILYDYLVNPAILRFARPEAECVCLGRHGRSPIWPQSRINEQLVSLAQQGLQVVRLKGGDPGVFARGPEEVAALRRRGVAFEIVPGITAALAAGSYAGVPITHRDYASAVALITGQECLAKSREKAMDYQAFAQFPGTLVFYMGVTTAPVWTSELIQAGKDPRTPAAIIRHCSLPDQTTVVCPLSEVARRIQEQRIRPPAIVIVGRVAALASSMSWFDQRPLFGQTILVTRPASQAEPLADALQQLGANVLVQPAIEIREPEDWSPVDRAIAELEQYDWLVFSSANGVRFFLDRVLHVGRDLRALHGVKLAAIGSGTSRALADYRLRVDLQPETFRAEALASALAGEAAQRRFLLLRASRGREVLAEQLVVQGGIVEQVVVYRSEDLKQPLEAIQEQFRDAGIEWITVTSSAIARSLAAMFGQDLHSCKLASISPVTSATLRELGFEPTAEAASYTSQGVVDAILTAELNHDG